MKNVADSCYILMNEAKSTETPKKSDTLLNSAAVAIVTLPAVMQELHL